MKLKIPFAGVLAGFLLTACTSAVEEPEPFEAYCIPQDFRDRIKIETISSGPVRQDVQLMGSVETNPDKVVNYVSLVKGVVENVNFSLGDVVRKGQVLAELKSSDLTSMQSQLTSIESEISSARRSLKAVESMHADHLASGAELEEANSRLRSLLSEKQRLQADLNLLNAHPARGVFQVKAPASGVITTKSINPGMQVTDESGVLFTVASLDEVWVMANVYATNLQTVAQGMPVEISTASYPGKVFSGSISYLPPVIHESERVLKARIELKNEALRLKPGMLVDVRVLHERRDTAATIAADAVVLYENENYVVVHKGNCDLSIRKIDIIAQNGDKYFVGEGLEAGEQIITQNQLLIFEQLKNFD